MMKLCPGCNIEKHKDEFVYGKKRRSQCRTCVLDARRRTQAGRDDGATAEERAERVNIINAFNLWFGPINRATPLAWRL